MWKKLNKYDAFQRRFLMKTLIETWLLLSVNLGKNKLVDHPFWQAIITCLYKVLVSIIFSFLGDLQMYLVSKFEKKS